MVTINGQQYSGPDCWSTSNKPEGVPMKTRHYQRIIKEWDQNLDISERDYLKLFNILYDKNFALEKEDTLQRVKIEAAVAWVVLENFSFKKKPDQEFEMLGKQVSLPESLKELSIGANIKARQTLDKSLVLVDKNKNFLNCDCYSMLLAIYLQPQLLPHPGGGFNWKKAKQLEAQIADLPIEFVFPIGFFLLRNVYEYGKTRKSNWLQILSNPILKGKKVFQNWLKFNALNRSLILR